MLKYLWISAVVIIADQATKLIADAQLPFNQLVHVLPYFDWRLSYNTGAAFSFLAGAGGWQRWFFTLFAIIVSLVLIAWLRKLPREDRVTATSLALILGGALGNAIDRVLHGHVIDFIQVWLGSYPWPAFNVADSAIFVGALLLIASGLFSPYRTSDDEKNHA